MVPRPLGWAYRRLGRFYPAVFLILELQLAFLVAAGTLGIFSLYYPSLSSRLPADLRDHRGAERGRAALRGPQSLPLLRPISDWIAGDPDAGDDRGGLARRGQPAARPRQALHRGADPVRRPAGLLSPWRSSTSRSGPSSPSSSAGWSRSATRRSSTTSRSSSGCARCCSTSTSSSARRACTGPASRCAGGCSRRCR